MFVSGGSSSIGAERVRGFAAQGARVGFRGTKADGGRALIDEVVGTARRRRGTRHATCATSPPARRCSRAWSELGPVRALVDNGGRDDRHAMEDVTPEFWDDRLALNLKHYFFAIQSVAPGMAAAGGGSIVNMSSVAWMRGRPNLVGYTAARAGVLGLTRVLARKTGAAQHPRQRGRAGRDRHRAAEPIAS